MSQNRSSGNNSGHMAAHHLDGMRYFHRFLAGIRSGFDRIQMQSQQQQEASASQASQSQASSSQELSQDNAFVAPQVGTPIAETIGRLSKFADGGDVVRFVPIAKKILQKDENFEARPYFEKLLKNIKIPDGEGAESYVNFAEVNFVFALTKLHKMFNDKYPDLEVTVNKILFEIISDLDDNVLDALEKHKDYEEAKGCCGLGDKVFASKHSCVFVSEQDARQDSTTIGLSDNESDHL